MFVIFPNNLSKIFLLFVVNYLGISKYSVAFPEFGGGIQKFVDYFQKKKKKKKR